MRKSARFSLLVLLVIVNAGICVARYPDSINPLSEMQVLECDRSAVGCNITLTFSQPAFGPVDSDSSLTIASYSGEILLQESGQPATPVLGGAFRLPASGGAHVSIVNAEYTTLTDIEYAAFAGELDEIAYSTCTLQQDAWYPGRLADIGEAAIFHDFRVANLLAHPVQVNPARNEVRVYSRMDIAIEYDGSDNNNCLPAPVTHISKTFLPWYRLLMDWDEGELDEYELYRGAVQVVMRDDDVLMTLMEDWFEWKRMKGWTLELLTDSDVEWSSVNIAGELASRYEENPFDFVVIIGDDQGSFTVPPGVGSGSPGGDQPYSTLAGGDNLADVHVGRISVNTAAQCSNASYKLVSYESEPCVDDSAGWFEHGLLHISDTHVDPQKKTMFRQMRSWMLERTYETVDTVFSTVDQDAIDIINDGVSFYSAQGYLGTALNQYQINELTNNSKLPAILEYSCYTGNWSQNTSLSEWWFRATNGDYPSGAIGTVGISTCSESQACLKTLNAGGAYSLIVLGDPHMGASLTGGKFALWQNLHGYNDSYYNNHCQWTNLIGDPTTWIWTDVPDTIVVNYTSTIEPGDHYYPVSVYNEATAIEGAWVTLYKVDNNEDFVATAETDASGYASLDLDIHFPGVATLTVTAQNCIPLQYNIAVDEAFQNIGFTELTIIDDGTRGTSGDGDGLADAGETIGLLFTLRNYGALEETNITLSATTDDFWLYDLTGTITLESLEPESETTLDDVILVTVDDQVRNHWLAPVSLRIDSDMGAYFDTIRLALHAPDLGIVADNINEGPGLQTLELEMFNLGSQTMSAGEIVLFSCSDNLELNTTLNTPELAVGQSCDLETEVTISDTCIPGQFAQIVALLYTDDGFSDTVSTQIVLGTPGDGDPAGPDNYGYYAFDIGDTSYAEYAPDYEWVEICPVEDPYHYEGTALPEQQGHSLISALVDLPFPVQFYGHTFEQVTITSMGFIAFGDQVGWPHNVSHRLPSAMAPQSMIAAYWDYFEMVEASGIYTYYDEANGRFIIEWYQLTDPNCTFEVILFDLDVAPSFSGDNDILCQYKSFQIDSYGGYFDYPYWTTGIQNQAQDDGLTYAYYNIYSDGAATLTNESAILFTTRPSIERNIVGGHVYDYSDSTPVADALVTINNNYTVQTDNQGMFAFEYIHSGFASLTVEADCYQDVDSTFLILSGDTLDLDVYLYAPGFELSTTLIRDTLTYNQSSTHSFPVSNPGDGILEYFIDIESTPRNIAATGKRSTFASELDEIWPRVVSFELDPSESSYRGLTFDGESFWISGSDNQNIPDPNILYRYSPDGVYLGSFDQPVPPEQRSRIGMYGLDWDDGCLYGVDNGVLYEMTFNGEAFEISMAIEVETNPARFLIVDPERGLFWMGDAGVMIRGYNLNGETALYISREDHRFFAGDMFSTTQGSSIRLIDWNSDNQTATCYELDVDNRIYTPDPDFPSDEFSDSPIGMCISHDVIPSIWTMASIIRFDEVDSVFIWNMEPFHDWLVLPVQHSTIDPGETRNVEFSVLSYLLPEDTYTLDLAFRHNACTDNPDRVTVELVVNDNAVSDNERNRPVEWALDAIWPNPFNPTTQIRFGLKEATAVDIRVFDILGREVTTLVQEQRTAGWYTIPFTANGLASGVYFVRINAGPLHETRKLVLLK